MSSQYVTATGGFAYGVIGADIHVFGDGTPLYVLELWRPPPALDDEWLREQPSRMLNARFAVVGFTGREQELRELREWCTQERGRAARWLHGPGGQGKTRMAHELAAQMAELGWTVAAAVEGPGGVLPPPGSQDLRPDGTAGLLLLVDYADRWPLSSLTWLFSNALLHRTDLPVRILLIARSTDIWPALRASLVNEQVSFSQQLLPPLVANGPDSPSRDTAAEPEGRHTMYRAALNGFAARYGVPPPRNGPADLGHPEFGLVLAVHMAALVAVDAHATGRTPPAPVPPATFDPAAVPALPGTARLALYLLDREQLNWARLYRERHHGRIATPPATMNRAVFSAALSGPRSPDSGTALLNALSLGRPTAEVLADHAICYPPPDPVRATVLEPLYPDRLAEDFVALTLPGHRAAYPAQHWAPENAAVTTRHDDLPTRAVTMLAAAAERWPHVGPRCLFPLLDENPDLAVAAGAPALLALANLLSIPDELLGKVLNRLPRPTPADLEVAAAVLRVRLLELLLDVADGPGAMAGVLVNHGNDLSLLGRQEEAVRVVLRAVSAFERLAVEQPEIYEVDVGKSLTNYANLLVKTGRGTEAVAAQERVVGIFCRLHGLDRPRYDLDLATALANLATHLERAGRWTEAYRANQEAIEHYRRREADDPRFRAGLAIALTNAAALTLRSAADTDTIVERPPSGAEAGGPAPTPGDGTETSFEAVRIWRELADADPIRYRHDLALALLNLRSELVDAARHEEAVAAITECVGLYRRLAGDNSLTYRQHLAGALGLLCRSLTAVGTHDEALAAGAESVGLWRQLAAANPDEHERDLVGALHNQNDALRAAGLPQDPEASARSPRVHLKDRVLQPGTTVEVSGWDRATELSATRDNLLRVADQFARRQDWPTYWEAVCRCSLTDAARLAHRIPVRRWHPADAVDRALLEALRSLPARRTATLIADASAGASTRLPAELDLFNEDFISFAHGSDALAVATTADGYQETIETLDLRTGTRSTLHTGPPDHSSITCVDASTVIAFRSPGHGRTYELVRHTGQGTTILARAATMAGARGATMLFGYVAGLHLFPVALVDEGLGSPSPDALRQVDLSAWGLSNGTLIAVDPEGTRLVLCDGYVLVAADALLGGALAIGGPVQPDAITDLTFVGRNQLLTSGQEGGLTLWQLGGSHMRPHVERATPRMEHLFSVPEWDVVGGKAPGEGRVHFLDPDTLAPRPAPPALTGTEHLNLITTSPDGRYVAYAGQLAVGEPVQRRDFDWHSRVYDLDHAGAVLQRPLTDLRLAATGHLHSAEIEARRTGNTHLQHLFTLALALAERSSGD
ncbi:tetratricopeptide repeat protein [Streptomyces sp. CEV 2-1]|uniref:tetratricopeptide repeat protein n=1 Tax=Streptomyces sp. CEV 2-1 TaxID=2485153 RepID=UPI000F47BD4E|nr:tetratricopeptide repeat protein [Streptomyces sp. CEV 2-1]ROQ77770.1 tetratricopeptide repeat protein [Streptomyces sp. CEV 2-1]